MDPVRQYFQAITRRTFFHHTSRGIGTIALASLLGEGLRANETGGALPGLHFPGKAKRVIYLFMSGGPSDLDLFDPKPEVGERTRQALPAPVRTGQRITGMTSGQAQLLMVGPSHKFARHPQTGMEMTELLPHTLGASEHLALIRSLHTDPINHDPAVTFINTGHQQPGRPTMGAWLSYGLGSENRNLPAFV